MSVTTGDAATVVLGVTDTEIVPQVSGKNRAFFIISNVGNTTYTFRFHVYDAAGSAAQGNAIFYDKQLGAGETISLDFYMNDDEKVSGLASAASVINVRVGLLSSTR